MASPDAPATRRNATSACRHEGKRPRSQHVGPLHAVQRVILPRDPPHAHRAQAAVMMARQSEQKTKSRTETLHAPSRARGAQRPVWRAQGAHPIWDAATPSALPRLYQAGATASECSSRVDPSPLRGVAPSAARPHQQEDGATPSVRLVRRLLSRRHAAIPSGGRLLEAGVKVSWEEGAHPHQQDGSRPL